MDSNRKINYLPIENQNILLCSPTEIENWVRLSTFAEWAFFVAPVPTFPLGLADIIYTAEECATGNEYTWRE